jgi:hypothetical protein
MSDDNTNMQAVNQTGTDHGSTKISPNVGLIKYMVAHTKNTPSELQPIGDAVVGKIEGTRWQLSVASANRPHYMAEDKTPSRSKGGHQARKTDQRHGGISIHVDDARYIGKSKTRQDGRKPRDQRHIMKLRSLSKSWNPSLITTTIHHKAEIFK